MRLTAEVARKIEDAGFLTLDTKYGCILKCKADPVAFFANPNHVLGLFGSAALLGAAVEADTYAAACEAAPAIAQLSKNAVRLAVEGILLSQNPEALAPIITASGLVTFGFKGDAPCLHEMKNVPAKPQARWWSLVHLTRADCGGVSLALGFETKLAKTLVLYQELFRLRRLPKDLLALKRFLSTKPKFDYHIATNTFAVFDERWNDQIALMDSLDKSCEPYRTEQLAITAPELVGAGVPKAKLAPVAKQLLSAVIQTPSLNVTPVLEGLAAGIVKKM